MNLIQTLSTGKTWSWCNNKKDCNLGDKNHAEYDMLVLICNFEMGESSKKNNQRRFARNTNLIVQEE